MKIKQALSKPISISFLINIIVFIGLNFISYSKFSCNIDIMMQTLLCDLAGVGGTSYVVFSNVFLMKVIKTLYEICPNVSWYMILQVVVCFYSLVALGTTYLSKKNNSMHKLFYVVFVIFVGYECYICPSYMKSSLLLCFSMLQILFSWEQFKKKTIVKSVGIILGMLISGMISIVGFWIGVFVGFLVFAIQEIFRKQPRKRYFVVIIVSFISIVSVCLINGANWKVYANKEEQWKEMKEYRFAIEKLEVFGYPEYQENFVDDIGIEEENYTYLKEYDEFFSAGNDGFDTLSLISKYKVPFNFSNVVKYFRIVPIRLVKVGLTYLLLVMCIALVESNEKDKKLRVAVAVLWVILMYMVAYIFNAWGARMTQMIVFVPVSFWIMSNLGDTFEIDVRESIAFLMVLGVVIYNNFSSDIITSVEERPMQELVAENVSTEYLSAINLNDILGRYSAYEQYEPGLLRDLNIVVINGNYGIYTMYKDYTYKEEYRDIPIWWYGAEINQDIYLIRK